MSLSLKKWLSFLNKLFGFRGSRSSRKTPVRRVICRLEELESRLTPSNTGTIHLTDVTATVVEETHYPSKQVVYAYGNQLQDGFYDVEVVAPGGKSGSGADKVLGISDPNSPVQVVGGHFVFDTGATGVDWETGPQGTAFNVWDEVISTGNTNGNPAANSTGYDDTNNPGGEYQVVLAVHVNGETADQEFAQFSGNNGLTKSKNFKVGSFTTLGTSISTTATIQPTGDTVNDTTFPPGPSEPLGSTATDTATVIDENGNPITVGTVTFHFFQNGVEVGTGTPVSLVGSDGTVTDPTVEGPLGAGSYYFTASYTDGTTYDSSDSSQEPFFIPMSNPTLTTQASSNTDTLPSDGSQVQLTDTATLSGAYLAAGGTITFSLYYNGGSGTSYTDVHDYNANVVAGPGIPTDANGNGTYSSDTYTLKTDGTTVAGNYYWSATYTPFSGDPNNNGAIHDGSTDTNEQVTINPATPSIVTQASPAITLGTTAPTISDQIVMSGAYFPTGNVNVKLTLTTASGTTTVKTDSFAAANGTVTENYPLPSDGSAAAGTYTWSVSYDGDGNNNSAVDEGGTAEQTVVTPATPSIVTTSNPTGTVTFVGTAIPVTDSAVVSGGYYETGSLVFTLTGPGGFSYTQTDTLHGNDTYTASTTLPATMAMGTYTWTVTYAGDANNNPANDQGDSAEQFTVSRSLNRTQGYWKTHGTNAPGGQANMWPVSSISIGGVTYTEQEAIDIMNASTNGNAISSLFQQLVAYKLNVLSHFATPTADQAAAAADADALIAQATGGHKLTVSGGVLNYVVKPSSTLGQAMVNDSNILTAFNQSGV
jgi:hypothetical protein